MDSGLVTLGYLYSLWAVCIHYLCYGSESEPNSMRAGEDVGTGKMLEFHKVWGQVGSCELGLWQIPWCSMQVISMSRKTLSGRLWFSVTQDITRQGYRKRISSCELQLPPFPSHWTSWRKDRLHRLLSCVTDGLAFTLNWFTGRSPFSWAECSLHSPLTDSPHRANMCWTVKTSQSEFSIVRN